MAAVRGVQNSATPCGHHDTFSARELIDDCALTLSEAGLTLELEDGRDVDAGPSLNLLVGIDEVQVQR